MYTELTKIIMKKESGGDKIGKRRNPIVGVLLLFDVCKF